MHRDGRSARPLLCVGRRRPPIRRHCEERATWQSGGSDHPPGPLPRRKGEKRRGVYGGTSSIPPAKWLRPLDTCCLPPLIASSGGVQSPFRRHCGQRGSPEGCLLWQESEGVPQAALYSPFRRHCGQRGSPEGCPLWQESEGVPQAALYSPFRRHCGQRGSPEGCPLWQESEGVPQAALYSPFRRHCGQRGSPEGCPLWQESEGVPQDLSLFLLPLRKGARGMVRMLQ